MAVVVYVDTNVLMEHTPLDQLPLAEILGQQVDEVVFPAQVLKELSKLKYSYDKRTRRRAEAAEKLVARLRKSGKVSGATCRVELTRVFDYSAYALDPDHGDDRVMATILDQTVTRPDSQHILLTADEYFAVLAEEHDVAHVLLEGYRLPVGEVQDHRPRPKPLLDFPNGGGFIELVVPQLPYRDEIEQAALDKYWTPREAERSAVLDAAASGILSSLYGDWPKSREDVLAHAHALDHYARNTLGALSLGLCLANEGTAPAIDVDVFLSFPAHQCRVSAESDLPEYPGGRSLWDIRMPYLGPPDAIDIEGPFVHEEEDGIQVVNYHVQGIKHGLLHRLNPLFLVPLNAESPESFGFTYSIHADNLEKPVEGELHVKLGIGGFLGFEDILRSGDE